MKPVTNTLGEEIVFFGIFGADCLIDQVDIELLNFTTIRLEVSNDPEWFKTPSIANTRQCYYRGNVVFKGKTFTPEQFYNYFTTFYL